MWKLTKNKGTALIEAAVTLPLICALIFFAIELVKMNLTQVAVDSITRECTFSLIANGTVKEFDNIINKYRPGFVPASKFRYYFMVFENLESMMAATPYGGQSIGYPGGNGNPTAAATSKSFGLSAGDPLLNKFQTDVTQSGEVGEAKRKSYLTTGAQGKAFVLTVVVDYPFSSTFTKKLFRGGSNSGSGNSSSGGSGGGSSDTEVTPGPYILWGRGSGIVNLATN